MTVVVAPVVGKDCKLYLNTGTIAAPVWLEIRNAINVSFTLGKGEADVSARFSAWKMMKGTLRELEISFTYRYLTGVDAVFDHLFTAYTTDLVREFLVLDGIVTAAGAQGIRAFCEVTGLNASQELEGAIEYDVTLKLGFHATGTPPAPVAPIWFRVP